MRALSLATWTSLLVTIASISSLVLADPLPPFTMHHIRLDPSMRPDQPYNFLNKLEQILRESIVFPRHYKNAGVSPVIEGSDPLNADEVGQALRSHPQKRHLIALGPAYPQRAGLEGLSAAFPLPDRGYSEQQTFAFLSAVHNGGRPKIFLNGFATVYPVPDIHNVMMQSHYSPTAAILSGSVLTLEELFEELGKGGWRHVADAVPHP